MLSVSRAAVRAWKSGQVPNFALRAPGDCQGRCRYDYSGSISQYVYLLGLYLGDGAIADHRRSVYRLRIACANTYPVLMDRCEAAMRLVMPMNATNRVNATGCTYVNSYSRHWPCLFPQHGPGKKHDREIKLETWQQALVDLNPRPLVEGLLHSDGCRVTNPIINRKTGKRYAYPRYHFSNVSTDIHLIFTNALDQLGIEWKQNNKVMMSVARKDSVAKLDLFVAPKC